MDELQKALNENAKKAVSHGYGEGTGERGWFLWSEGTRKVEPFNYAELRKKTVDAPFVIGDEIEPTMSMTGTDKIHTSKSTLRREYKELGFVETGGAHLGQKPERVDPEKKHREIREDILKSMNDLRWGNVPQTEKEKEICQREERQYQEYVKRQR